MSEAVFPMPWEILTAQPKASTAPWTLKWTESQSHTVSFSDLHHITLPKQCMASYKTSELQQAHIHHPDNLHNNK